MELLMHWLYSLWLVSPVPPKKERKTLRLIFWYDSGDLENDELSHHCHYFQVNTNPSGRTCLGSFDGSNGSAKKLYITYTYERIMKTIHEL